MNMSDDGFEYIRKQLLQEEYVTYDFGDCLKPEYTIPGLIAYMVRNAADKFSYEVESSDVKPN